MDRAAIARVVIGLASVTVLAVVAAHPRVRELERKLGVNVLLATGLPFLVLGFVFRLDSVGILSERILGDLRPAFHFGLGWLGFAVGMQFDIRRLDRLHGKLASVITVETVLPMLTCAAACAGVLLLLGLSPEWPGGLWRDVLVLCACAAASAPVTVDLLARELGVPAASLLEEVTNLDEVASFAMLGLVAIFLRPEVAGVRWDLPPSAWLLVTVGLGTLLGAVTYILLRGATSAAEELTMLLGAVALSAGVAGYLALSVPVICAIAGALLANLPHPDTERIRKVLADVERPLYLVFLVVVGASWRPGEWQGWVLAPAFVVARMGGKILGARLARQVGPPDLPHWWPLALTLLPQSPTAIVIIVSASLLHAGEPPAPVRWAINAILIGSVLSEILVHVVARKRRRARSMSEITPVPFIRQAPP